MNVRTNHIAVVAVLLLCGGPVAPRADESSMREALKLIKTINTAFATSAFMYIYGAEYQEEQMRLLFNSPRQDAPVTAQNYGDAYFMRRHVPLQRW